MTLNSLGIALFAIGLVIAWGHGPVPPGGFSNFPKLLNEYREAKKAGRTPTEDATYANVKRWSLLIGGTVSAIGALLWIISKLDEAMRNV